MQSSGESQVVNFDWEHYEKQLKHFDWWYEMSDDHSVWKRGCDASWHLKNLYKEALAHDQVRAKTLWDQYCPYKRK